MKTEQNPKGAGRKSLPEHLKKVKLHDFRLPKWIVEWLLSHKGKGSQLLEEAVTNYFHLNQSEELTIQNIIQDILERIPSHCTFDSHFVIHQLRAQYPEQYTRFVGESDDMEQATRVAHGMIGKLIKQFDGRLVEKFDYQAWSENMNGTVNRCACWLKL